MVSDWKFSVKPRVLKTPALCGVQVEAEECFGRRRMGSEGKGSWAFTLPHQTSYLFLNMSIRFFHSETCI